MGFEFNPDASPTHLPPSLAMAPLQFDLDDITLETSLQNPSVDIEAVLLAWEELHPYSVDTVATQRPELFEFTASDDCIMLAAIELRVTMPEQSNDEEEGREGKEDNAVRSNVDETPRSATEPEFAEEPIDEPSDPVRYLTTTHTVGVLYLRKTEFLTEYNIGLVIHPEWRGCGLAEKVLTKGLAHAFNDLWAHRVQALIMDGPSSDAARSVFTSLGFTFEGIRRRAIMSPAVGGGYRDVIGMAMLDTEWHVRAHGRHGQHGVWDEMFVRHHKEQEDLLQWEERRRRLRRTGSMETIREGAIAELALTSGAPSPTASSVDLTDHPSSSTSSSVDPGDHMPVPPGLRLRTEDPSSDVEGPPLGVPSSPASSTASWSDLDATSQPTPPQGKGRRKRRGKGRAGPNSSRGSYHGNSYSSDASSGWDVL